MTWPLCGSPLRAQRCDRINFKLGTKFIRVPEILTFPIKTGMLMLMLIVSEGFLNVNCPPLSPSELIYEEICHFSCSIPHSRG